ncbi:MAG: H-NS histone family protein [Burkholderiaceae bacterium]|nr:H-NS histone family protein [Burkholderiaceae bacterium]MDH3461623.1 H-NS histone family protein [Burkholderiaceae bacterium]
MPTLKELLAQKTALENQIKSATREERAEAIAKVKSLMAEYGLTPADLRGKHTAKSAARGGSKVAAKYRNAATGDTWSGRGLRPNWLKAALAAGKRLEDFKL